MHPSEWYDENGAPVTCPRTIEDSERIRSSFIPGGRIAIIGGGWIGLEVASAARAAGSSVDPARLRDESVSLVEIADGIGVS